MSKMIGGANSPAHDPDLAPAPAEAIFDHEKLKVYQDSITFCGWVGLFLAEITGKAAAKDQLDRASTSIPLNIAEGNGKFSDHDRARFLEMARGSALECAACLDVLVIRRLAGAEQVRESKQQLARIVRMLIGLLKRFSSRASVLPEEEGFYGSVFELEHEHDYEQESR